ncbi:MAG: PAS domain-containing protein [Rhodoferax sp.]|nr:PAS domain-containing protein [Rhodoferax sp.]
MFIKDAQSRFLILNKAGEKQLGLRHDDLYGTDASQFFLIEQMQHFLDIDRMAFERGHAFDLEETVWSVGLQQNRICHTFKNPVFDAFGKPLYLICTMIDITDQKRTEEELRTSHENLQSILETSLDGYWQVDLQGRITDVNAAACAMLGYTKLEMLALSVTDITVIDNEERLATYSHICL